MSKSKKLIMLLEDYVVAADLWEDFYRKAANKKFRGNEEKEAHRYIQSTYTIPLMEKCRRYGHTYAELIGIIPTAFKTSKAQRRSILDDLRAWAQEEHLQ